MLFFQPSIFYGISGLLVLPENAIEESALKRESEKPFAGEKIIISRQAGQQVEQLEYLSKSEVAKIRQDVARFLHSEKPFLLQVYSVNDFARDISIPSKKLSAYLNNCEQLNYRDFINQCRIDYCIEKLNNKDWQNLTLEAISKECGFNNRNTFTNAFKKKVGKTPSDYLLQIK